VISVFSISYKLHWNLTMLYHVQLMLYLRG
jgi:hypothetical protein